jgi:tubulin-specific chaperone D
LIPNILNQLAIEKEGKNSARKERAMKLLTRLGLTYLKPRIAVWAFRKKKQSLLKNLEGCAKTQLMTNTHLNVESKAKGEGNNQIGTEDDTSYYSDVDKNNLEEIIDMLVEGLTEKETVVRE